MERTIKIGGKDTRLVANGGTPRLYRAMFKRDVFRDMPLAVNDDGTVNDSAIFENIAFVMAKQGGLEGDIDSWLASFDSPLAILEASPDIIGLWTDTTDTSEDSKKK